MSFIQENQTWVLLAGAIVGYLLVMFTNPAKPSLRDGIRCLFRYRSIWSILALFGLCYAVFSIGVDVFCHYKLPEGQRPMFQWSRPWFLPWRMEIIILKQSVLPAVEGVAGLFNLPITTFPFSALAALFFFGNKDGHHKVLVQALHRRFGPWGWLIHLGIIICALAAIAKPFLYGPLLPVLAGDGTHGLFLLQCSYIVNWLSFLFEIMFGICVQIYLILMVYAWVRGLNFTKQHLLDFAIRRFSFVMKWTGIVMLLSSLLIYLPQILSVVQPFSHMISTDMVIGFINNIARPSMATFLILFSGIQIILTFHSESLRKAFHDHLRFLGKDAWTIFWFLLIALVHLYLLNVVNSTVIAGFASLPDEMQGPDFVSGTAVTFAWRLVYPLIQAFVIGWLLASWVCLYKRSEAGRVHAGDWIKY